MSNRLIKNGSPIELVGDEVIASVRILKSGQIQVEAPTVPPVLLIKFLHNAIVDIMYTTLQPAEISRVQPPM